uniref:Fatty acyl-CoA reductase n=1 Tax=Timema shepardi TaxID=629360 RepID=A0A7R9FWX8_TIMSH|nr:unnamed protein product [Timema shepardi]
MGGSSRPCAANRAGETNERSCVRTPKEKRRVKPKMKTGKTCTEFECANTGQKLKPKEKPWSVACRNEKKKKKKKKKKKITNKALKVYRKIHRLLNMTFDFSTHEWNFTKTHKRLVNFTSVLTTNKPLSMGANTLRILSWNANGILQQVHEFEEILQTYGIDLALLGETHLNADKRFNITGYNTYRTDRAHGRGGGTAVVIRNYLPHYRSTIQDTENLEATAVTVNTKGGHINFVAAYNPPNKMLLKTDLDTVTTGDHFLIGGDLNCKNTLWNSRLTNRQGRILEEHASDAEYNITNETLTVLQELDSDHNPILCEWDVDTEHKNNWRKPTIKTTNWVKFNTELLENIPRNLVIETQEDVDAAIDVLTMTIQETYRVNTTTSQKHQDIRSDHPDLNYLIAQKREARRDWQRLRTQQERTRYNHLKAQVRRKVNEYRRAKWNTFVTDTVTDTHKSWTITKILKGTAKKVGTPAIHGQGGMAYTSVDKANAIAETLKQQFSPNPVQEASPGSKHLPREISPTHNSIRATHWQSQSKIAYINITKIHYKMDSQTGHLGESKFEETDNDTCNKGTDIQEFYRDCNVLITGGTGFVGKLLIEKLLRSCPATKNIFTIIRPKKGKSPEERKEKLLKCVIFDSLKATSPNFHEKLVMVSGDISLPNLGLSTLDYEMLSQQVNIIFHLAATVKFDEKVNIAVPINIFGTMEIIKLCRKCVSLKDVGSGNPASKTITACSSGGDTGPGCLSCSSVGGVGSLFSCSSGVGVSPESLPCSSNIRVQILELHRCRQDPVQIQKLYRCLLVPVQILELHR